jgi:NAD(P)-dependent dehydrogenase (short-subunit alcohol dehydrogenase family)
MSLVIESVKTTIITGGGGHLGRAVARFCARPGAHLVLIDKDSERLEKVRADLAPLGAELTVAAADAAEAGGLKAVAASLPQSLWQSPPSLVLAHALSGKDAKAKSAHLGELDRGQWSKVVDVNLTSVVFAIQLFLPFMRQAGGGRIVLVSSTAALSASPTAALSYSVTKAAVAALPLLLAPELANAQVLINAVAPGKFSNPDWPDDPDNVKRYKRSVPLGRLASVDEVAALIGFLISSMNTYVTGQTIVQDGGRLSASPTVDQR